MVREVISGESEANCIGYECLYRFEARHTLAQELFPVIAEMGTARGHTRQSALITRLAEVAAAPWTAVPIPEPQVRC